MVTIKTLGIMSDSHDNMKAIRSAVNFFNEKQVDYVIHAGDLIAPFTAREIKRLVCPYEIVLGNNDGEILGLYKIYDGHVHQPPFHIELNGRSILVLHDPILVKDLYQKTRYDLIIYGHDHEAFIDKLEDGTLIVNPGECGGWLSGKSTIAICNLETIYAEIHFLSY